MGSDTNDFIRSEIQDREREMPQYIVVFNTFLKRFFSFTFWSTFFKIQKSKAIKLGKPAKRKQNTDTNQK